MTASKRPIHIQFVCHGNICRSTMAEFVFKDLVNKAQLNKNFIIDSTATSREEIGNDTHPGTKTKLRALNIPFTPRKARQITKDDYNSADYIIIMDENNRRNLERLLGPDTDHKIHKMLSFIGEIRDVKDPWYTGNFDETYDDIAPSCKALLKHLILKYSL
ncbi:low molecular weight protein-tyrosine-phosphatase [Veillonella criceti]|uniref:protein-tyrosine-phosphatase n=1 Tax=Veillonella criceti TaxID=103891 RepID=A0A380NLG3_9FIRM|nr:low molecular weight protein-tyrosine-phosphatase [Veillonella criceti]SUP43106.1 Low molecular weight protein-tyrosine-phosphatase yfkJ [Veillonella criceti]